MLSQEELVQIMAVGVSILEDQMFGLADGEKQIGRVDGEDQTGFVLTLIRQERESQDDKWGPQHHDAEEWAMILLEEMGEWAGEVLKEAEEEVVRKAEEGMSLEAWEILRGLYELGDVRARHWLKGHEWSDRQQEVFDGEA